MNSQVEERTFIQRFASFFKKPLVRYVFKRIGNSMITLFFITTAVFLLLRMIPKETYIDYGKLNKIPESAREAYIESIYERFGLNDPVHIQLLNYYRDILPIPTEVCVQTRYDEYWQVYCHESETVLINFGNSVKYKNGKPVMTLIEERFPVSFKLAMWFTLFMYVFGYPLGVAMAKNKGKWVDKLGNGYIVLTMAVPGIVFYYLWLIISMMVFRLPSVFDSENWLTWITPVWAVAFMGTASTALWVRRFMVDEMNSDYVKFARSKGLSERKIMFTHVLRNAIVRLVRGIPVAIMLAVMGSYFVEMLWNIPGSGNLLILAIRLKDNPLVQGLTIIYAILSMTAYLLGDLVTVFMDPRISLTENK